MTITMNGEQFFTATEAAEYLGVSRPTFYQNVQPHLPEYRYGALRRIRYRQSDLDQYKGIRQVEHVQEQ